MILIEDANNEKYHINPTQVIYVKERDNLGKKMWKITMVNGESLMTKNEQGAMSIIASIKRN
jgi:hypothetical protein